MPVSTVATDYRVCTRCVMDTSDPEIVFDADGVCNHCHEFDQTAAATWFPNAEGERRLQVLLESVRMRGRGRRYDSLLGLSGGVDSSYLALKAHEWGLRPLLIHVDAGWNSELAVQNIERIVKTTGFDLHTHVVDWEVMRRLQLSYLRAGVANQDAPQDHAFFAGVTHFGARHRIHDVLSGGNMATEGVLPRAWQGPVLDAWNLRAIHHRHGDGRLRGYPTVSPWGYFVGYPLVTRTRYVRPLNLLPYSKQTAVGELEKAGWRSYDRKHGESVFTSFFQNYYLPRRFGYDKRRPHLSSRVVAGSLTRDEALEILERPLYDPEEMALDIEYVCRKLRITDLEFEELMAQPARKHTEYRNWSPLYNTLNLGRRAVSRATGRSVRLYSA